MNENEVNDFKIYLALFKSNNDAVNCNKVNNNNLPENHKFFENCLLFSALLFLTLPYTLSL